MIRPYLTPDGHTASQLRHCKHMSIWPIVFAVGAINPSDIALITPVFYKGNLIAFSASIAHKSDVGGMVPGSASGSAREIFHEGILIPGVRYWGPDGVVSEVLFGRNAAIIAGQAN